MFGGPTGDDPDFLLLTITGKSDVDTVIGTIDFYLADFRFEDNTQDFIVDQWTEVDLTSIADAAELEFSITSSDVGPFGLNTPAYAAIDDITLVAPALSVDIANAEVSESSGTDATTVRISRPEADAGAVVVAIEPVDPSIATVPTLVTIEAGEQFVDFTIDVIGNEISGPDQTIAISASAVGFVSSSKSLVIVDDDQPTLTVNLDSTLVEGETLTATVVRSGVDLTSPLSVEVQADDSGLVTVDQTVVIPAGLSSQTFTVEAIDDSTVRPTTTVELLVSATDFESGLASFEVTDNDQPSLFAEFVPAAVSESVSGSVATFEDFGASLTSESFYNGSDGAGGFTSGELAFNNSYNFDFDVFSGWAVSNTTDVTTPGFTNQYSAFTGAGAFASDSYAVAAAFITPTITRDESSGSFQSIEITNTTFAALSILQGDSFAKQFGGDSGDDPDFFLLTIEGFDSSDDSVGTIDFYLADYRFEDNSQDFIVDSWTTVDLSPLGDATELQFSLSSSDVGDFGINTPAYFAVDNVTLASETSDPMLRISRNTTLNSEALPVQLTVDSANSIVVPEFVEIPANQTSVSVPVRVVDDLLFGVDQLVSVTADAENHTSSTSSLNIIEDDQATITLSVLDPSVSEASGLGRLVVYRNSVDLSSPLQVNLSVDAENQITIDSQVTIPAGSRSFEIEFLAVDNDQVDEDRQILVTGSAIGFLDGQSSFEIIDDEQALSVQFDVNSISESDALPTATFEELGARLASESFDNGSDLSGGFTSGPLDLNNVFDPTFGSWSGWSISNTTDTTTPGFGNQFSAFTGSGALGSDTYAVANAFPGGTVPTLSRNDGGVGFESLLVTNTTFAAQSILQGDSFARQFGGESGNDPDFFLLHIEGFDSAEQSVGVIDFYLADYRFDDNSLDFLVDEWTTVDLSGLTNAVELQFSLTSSDVGAFGLNTPAFFAVDQVSVSEPNANSITGTVSRSGDDLSEPLTVELQSDATEVSFPSTVVIAAGESSASFAVAPVDDALVDGDQTVDLILSADSFQEATTSITVVDDDEATLTLTLSNSSVSESDGDQAATLLVHRNTLRDVDSPTINLVGSDDFSLGDDVTIPANSASVEVTVGVVDNDRVDGDRELSIIASAAGFLGSSSALTVQDDEVAGFTVIETGDGTTVDERSGEDQIQVVLAAEPLSDVVVDLISSSGDVRSSLDQLTFTPANWNQPQFVTIIGVPDLTLGDSPVDFSFTINGEQSNALFVDLGDQSVSVTVIDHQPDSIVLEVGQGEIVLTDLAREIEFGRSDESGIQVVGNELTQGLFIEDLSPVAVDVDVDLAGGDDNVTLFGSAFTSIEGGEGHDRLIIGLTGEIGLVEFLRDRVTGFEEVQLGDDVILTIDTANLDQVTGTENTLLINVTGDELVRFEGTGQQIEPLIVEDRLVQVIQFGEQFIQLLTNRPLQNGFIRHDVDQSGSVTASDALSIINELAIAEESESPPVVDVEDFEGNFYDVNGDNRVTALDALQVINELARQSLLVDSEAVAFAPAPNDDDDEEFGSSINSEAVDFIFGELF